MGERRRWRVWGLLLVLLGVLVAWGAAERYATRRAVASWPAVPCTVERSELRVEGSDSACSRHPTHYSLELRYRYQVDGRTYRGSQYSLDENDWSCRGEADAAHERAAHA